MKLAAALLTSPVSGPLFQISAIVPSTP